MIAKTFIVGAMLAASLGPTRAHCQDAQQTFVAHIERAGLNDFQLRAVEQAYIDATVKTLIADKIPGGTPAKDGELPWMAALFVEDSVGNQVHLCGATLISKNKLVTAAHCNVVPTRAYRVKIGDLSIAPPLTNLKKVATFISHPNYVDARRGNDIAVITLQDEVNIAGPELDNALPLDSEVTLTVVAGWGATEEGGSGSDVLLKALVPLVPLNDCKKPYPHLPENTVCAGYKAGGIDTCQGDSGGPLLQVGANKKLSLTGVTSYGYGCARQGYYGIYTSIPAFRDWILSQ